MNSAPHPFSLRQLQYAVAVRDTLSFRGAAAQCGVSQPSLSAQLSQLEQALGVKLFERDRRGVRPTIAGELLIERARHLLLEGEDFLRASRVMSDPLCGTLRIGVIPTVAPYLLPSVTPAFRQTFPKLSLIWSEEKTDTLVERLGRGQLDAALLALEADIGDLARVTIAKDPFVLALRADDALARKKTACERADLRQVDVLLLDDGHCFRDQALSYCSRVKASELQFRATSLSTLAHMVAGGAGVTLLPKLAVSREAKGAGLVTRVLKSPAPSRTIGLVWRKRSTIGPALRKLSAVVRAAYPES